MKKRFSGLLVAAVASLFISSPSQALVCLAPHPACAVVAVGGLVVAILGSMHDADNGKIDPLMIETDEQKITEIVKGIRNSDYSLRMADYYRYSGGYQDIISRYKSGKISGNLSLESLYDFNPRLFADLDQLEQKLLSQYPAELVASIYGPKLMADGSMNWKRYSLLAQDAIALYSNLFKIK